MRLKLNHDILIINSVFILLYGVLILFRPFNFPDLFLYAQIPREMLARHDLITPFLNAGKYLEEPPLYFWLQMAVIKFFGFHHAALRFVSFIFGLIGLNIFYNIGVAWQGRLCGYLTVGIIGFNVGYMTYAATLSPILLGLTFLSMSFLQIYHLFYSRQEKPASQARIIWIFLGLMLLTLPPLTLMMPLAALLGCCLKTQRFDKLKPLLLPSGVGLFLLITLPWLIFIQKQTPFFLQYYFIQNSIRFFSFPKSNSAYLLLGLFPGILLTIYSLPRFFKQPLNDKKQFLLIWLLVSALYIFVGGHQQLYWSLLLLPALALLTALVLAEQPLLRPKKIALTIAMLSVIGSISLAIAIPRMNPPSVSALVEAMKPYLTKEDVVVSYHHFYVELSVLLQQPIVVVDWENKPIYRTNTLTDYQFWPYWNKKERRFFMFVPKTDYRLMSHEGLANQNESIYYIASNEKTVLITNMPLTKQGNKHG